MFATPTRTSLFLAGWLFFTLGAVVKAQPPVNDLLKIQQQSLSMFKEGDYRSALEGFRDLMDKDPQNPDHAYYAGRCLVELNEKLPEAIELLYGASLRGVPPDVEYYLGLAYHRNYNFQDALKHFNRYLSDASRQEVRESDVKHLMATSRSAREMTMLYNPVDVLNVTFIDLFDSIQYSKIKMKGGTLQRKPASFFQSDEDREGLTSLMFIPANMARGETLYYSGYGRSGKEGAQIFRIKRATGRSWGIPEEIKEVNSEGNEILPYFDPIGEDLYFASDGRPGIGGYDLFKSHYDSKRDQWSDPLNLGFPINSVVDEYLFLPGSDLGLVLFFTTRHKRDSLITVYRVKMVEPKQQADANDFKKLKEIANLGGKAEEVLAQMEALDAPTQDREVQSTPGSITREKVPSTDYRIATPEHAADPVLAEALRHQALSDSLKDLATSARVKVRESGDPNDRWVWQKQIMLWEKRANDEETKADELYAQIHMKEADQDNRSAVNVPEAIEVDTVMEDLTVYRFVQPASSPEGEPGTPPGETVRPEITRSISYKEPDKEKSEQVINRFDILGHSPYSEKNPIPLDLPVPEGAFYRIQLGAFGKEVGPDAFSGLSPITGERIPERGLIKYYAGKFSRYDDASMALSVVRSKGFEDAFIVAWYNGNPVTTQRAKQLE